MTEPWDSDALDRAYAEVRKRRSRADAETAAEADAELGQPTPIPSERAPHEPAPDIAPAPDHVPGHVLYAAGIVTAIAAVLAGGIWCLVSIFGTQSTNASPTAVATSAYAVQSTAPVAPIDTASPFDPSPSPSATTPSSSPTPLSDPAQVVNAFYAAINAGDWQTAWDLGGDNLGQTYDTFVAGFNNTYNDAVTAQDTSATTASIQLTATQNDGTEQQYSGTYTVVNGVITSADISPVS